MVADSDKITSGDVMMRVPVWVSRCMGFYCRKFPGVTYSS